MSHRTGSRTQRQGSISLTGKSHQLHLTSPLGGCILAVALAVLALLPAAAGAAVPSIPDTTASDTDCCVNAVARGSNGLTYIGGSFTLVGPHTGAGARLSRTSGVVSTNRPDVAGGDVDSVVGDRAGGFYIGGDFTHVGGVARAKVAHIEPDGSLDPTFNPPGATDGRVDALAFSKDGRLYAGGLFTTIGGAGRNRIAELDAATGAAESFNPGGVGANISVSALEVVGDSLYVGGNFTTIGGQARNRIARLNANTGAVDAYDPDANLAVSSLEFGPEGTLYVGGSFTTIDSVTRNRVAQLDANGDAMAFDPNVDGGVRALSFSHGLLYIGGVFANVNGATPRNNIAAVATSGTATAFNPNSDDLVNTLERFDDTVFVGGEFTNIGGEDRARFAAISASSGDATSFAGENTNGDVQELAVNRDSVYVGGEFTAVGMKTRNKIAALDSAGRLDPTFNPDATPTGVNIFALLPAGNVLYVGGSFSQIGGQPRNDIAKLSATTGNAFSAFNPDANNTVRALALLDGALYAGGSFTNIGGQPRNGIAKLSATSGNAFSAWNPDADGAVLTLGAANGAIYAGGFFENIGGLARNKIAKLSATSGNAFSAWNPNPINGPDPPATRVDDLIVSGSAVYVGGGFTQIGGLARNNIAKLSATSGNAFSAFNGNAMGADPRVFALALSGSVLYAGGPFTNIGGQPRNHLAALSTTSGNAFSSFNPNVNAIGGVDDLAATSSALYVGGGLSGVGNFSNKQYAQFTGP